MNGGTQILDGISRARALGGGGGSPSVPSDISGLLVWWKTESLVGPSNGNPITSWPDASGNSKTATPNGTAFIYRTNVINSRAVVEIQADYAPFTSTNLGTAHTVFIVFRPIVGFSDGVLLGGDAAGKYTPYVDSTDIYYRAQLGDSPVNVAHGGLSNNTAYLLEVVRSGTSVSFYKNGSQLSTTQTLGANTALAVMQLSGNGGGALVTGQIAEVFFYDSALSTSDRQAMETYVNGRFSLF